MAPVCRDIRDRLGERPTALRSVAAIVKFRLERIVVLALPVRACDESITSRKLAGFWIRVVEKRKNSMKTMNFPKLSFNSDEKVYETGI